MSKKKRVLLSTLGLIVCLSTSVSFANDALLSSWSASWERVIDNALTSYLERAAKGPLSGLDEDSGMAAIEDLYNLLYPSVSWDGLGQTFVENMQSSCGNDILNSITPFFTGEKDSSAMTSELAEAYASCAQSGVQKTMESVGSVIQSKGPQITEVYAKYGIKYP